MGQLIGFQSGVDDLVPNMFCNGLLGIPFSPATLSLHEKSQYGNSNILEILGEPQRDFQFVGYVCKADLMITVPISFIELEARALNSVRPCERNLEFPSKSETHTSIELSSC